jgi:hypothetical protein
MRNPTRKQVDFVIKKLQSVRKQATFENAFHMMAARVYNLESYRCGTVHCMAGWYAVANLDRKFIDNKIKKGCVGYEDGAELMADDLGFDYRYELDNWAHDNPKIWGNKRGGDMFESDLAYDDEGFDGVIAQWQTVRDNLPEAA